jgi:hypothetical protein
MRCRLLCLLAIGVGCKSNEPLVEAEPRNTDPVASHDRSEGATGLVDAHEQCAAPAGIDTEELWGGWLSRRGGDRQGPEPERVGDTCLLTDLQFMDAPLYRVRETAGEGIPLIAALPGVRSEYDSSKGDEVVPGELVLGSQTVGEHRCVYAVNEQGTLSAGFVLAKQLERVEDPPSQPLDQLVGHWAEEGWEPSGSECVPDHFSIARTPDGRFVLEGQASWCCGCDAYDTHFGGNAGEISSCEGEGFVNGDCQMALRQRGPFLMVVDDGTCGGMNVRFLGIFLRSSGTIPFRSPPN